MGKINKEKQKLELVEDEDDLLDSSSTGPEDEEDEDEDEEVLDDEDMDDLEESAEDNLNSLKANSKSAMMMQTIQMLAGMKIEDISNVLDTVLAQVGKEADGVPDGAADKNKASVTTKAMKEDIELIFGTQQLSEEFKTRVETLLESTLATRVELIKVQLEEENDSKIKTALNETVQVLAETADLYLEKIADKWLEDNKVSIENSLKTELTESFINGMLKLCETHGYKLPDENIDIVETLVSKVEELEEKYNETLNSNIELIEELDVYKMLDLIDEASTGMALSDVQKFKKLAEGIEYDGDDEVYKNKLNIIKETYFGKKPSNTKIVTEEIVHSEDETDGTEAVKIAPEMKRYVEAISRTIKR